METLRGSKGVTQVHAVVVSYVPPRNASGIYRTFPRCAIEHDDNRWQDVEHDTFEHALLSLPGIPQVCCPQPPACIYLVTVNLSILLTTAALARRLVENIAARCWREAQSETRCESRGVIQLRK